MVVPHRHSNLASCCDNRGDGGLAKVRGSCSAPVRASPPASHPASNRQGTGVAEPPNNGDLTARRDCRGHGRLIGVVPAPAHHRAGCGQGTRVVEPRRHGHLATYCHRNRHSRLAVRHKARFGAPAAHTAIDQEDARVCAPRRERLPPCEPHVCARVQRHSNRQSRGGGGVRGHPGA